MSLLKRLSRLEMLVITGKGGVGKSVVSATLGRLLAGAGRRVLLLEIDPRENLYQLLKVSPSDGEIVEAAPRLWLQSLQPRDVMNQVVREQLRVDFLVRRILDSPVYHHFAEGAPGLRELAVMAHALRILRGLVSGVPRVDQVVLDAPASGHSLALLTAPGLVTQVIRTGPFGRMGAQLAGFVADPERCGVLVTTLAEEMPVTETVELCRALDERMSREPELLVVNGLYPPAPTTRGRGESRGVSDLWRERRGVNERWLARLQEAYPGPRVELPLLPIDRGPDLVAALRERFEVAAAPESAGAREASCS